MWTCSPAPSVSTPKAAARSACSSIRGWWGCWAGSCVKAAPTTGAAPHRGRVAPNTPLFRSQSGRRLGARAIQLKFASWVQEAGIDRPVSVPSLRHTFATRLYEKTGDLYLVQRALGHRQITTTEVYARVSDDALRTAVGAV